jgi:hypothetical protein
VIISKRVSLRESTKDPLCTHGPVWSSKQARRQATPSFDKVVNVRHHSLELIPNTAAQNASGRASVVPVVNINRSSHERDVATALLISDAWISM